MRRDLAFKRSGLVLVSKDCLGLLIVKTGPWDGAIMWDPLLVVNTVVGLPSRTKRELLACVVAGLWLFEVAGQLVSARLWELVKILYSTSRVQQLDSKRLSTEMRWMH